MNAGDTDRRTLEISRGRGGGTLQVVRAESGPSARVLQNHVGLGVLGLAYVACPRLRVGLVWACSFDFEPEPGAGVGPVFFSTGDGDFEGFGGLFYGEAGEEAEFG